MRSSIKKLDFFFKKSTLTFNRKGELGYKTFIGGLISLFALIFIISFSFHFIYKMLIKKDSFINKSTTINPYINITYSHKLPFLLRLTDKYSHPFENDEKLYFIKASFYYRENNNKNILINDQKYISLKIEKCNINKHFSNEYKDYFHNFNNINSYYCLDLRNSSQTIYGIYDDKNPFSYYSFNLEYCHNSTENNNSCYSINEIKNKFNNLFLDFIFLDYSIDSLNKKDVKKGFIRKERFELSTILFKKIWIYFKNIKYIIDNDNIFQKKKIDNFHKYHSIKIDSIIIENENNFAILSILNNMKSSIYNKEYIKFENYISLIGGLINITTLFFSFLNYYNAKNSYYLKLIKDFVIENKNNNNFPKVKINSNHLTSTIFYKTKSNIDCFGKNESGIIMNQKRPSTQKIETSFNKIKSSIYLRILPTIFISKKNSQTLILYQNFINSRLSIINILKKIEMIQVNYDSIRRSIQGLNNNNTLIPGNSKINNYISEINNI